MSTRVLSPRLAVVWAAFFNFVAFLVFGTVVAATIAKGVVDPDVLSIGVVFAGLVGAIGWNLITFYLGLPTSSSHALVGGIAGAAVAKGGIRRAHPAAACGRSACSSCCRRCSAWRSACSLMIGMHVGACTATATSTGSTAGSATASWSRRPRSASATAATTPRRRWASSSPCSSAAATCPPARTCRSGSCSAAHTAIGLGTLTGGWRIVKTMGSKITKLQPVGGVAAESAAAATLFFTSHAGIPVSTTHTITGAIVGVGASRRLSAVRWGVAGRVVWAWILTIPGAWLIATVTYAVVAVFS